MTERKTLFYVKDLEDQSIWAVHEIDTDPRNRLGWLSATCVDIGNNGENYIGADCGMDAEFVFTSPSREVSKTLSTIQK